MNRRTFLQSAVAVATAGLLVPSWLVLCRRRLDLSPFCQAVSWDSHPRYNLSAPFVQGGGADMLHRYATDARICVRADAEPWEAEGAAVKLPPAGRLGWDHDALTGWRPWPARPDYRVAAGMDCPACRGLGWKAVPSECERCQGVGCIGDACPTCAASGSVVGPCIQYLGDVPIDAKYDAKIRQHLGDAEYMVMPSPGQKYNDSMVCFRFDGGLGLLMSMDPERTEERIRLGREA